MDATLIQEDKFNEDIFIINHLGKLFAYLPKERFVFETNESLIKIIRSGNIGDVDKKLYNFFVQNKIILHSDPKMEYSPSPGVISGTDSNFDYNPNSLTILPTMNCNLRCIYCYSCAGESNENVSIYDAKSALDFCINNCQKNKRDLFYLSLHGGGEPLLDSIWPIVQQIIIYANDTARKVKLDCKIFINSNGIASSRKLEWLVGKVNHIQISIDGPEEIQAIQRPFIDGKNSYFSVVKTIKQLNNLGISCSIRSTITSLNVDRMSELIDLFSSFPVNLVHFEPLFLSGRATTNSMASPDQEHFLRRLIDAISYAEFKKVKLTYSGYNLKNSRKRFCGAAGHNFILTPAGNITSCLEVGSINHRLASTFIYGHIEEKNRVHINYEKINYLKTRTVDHLENCKDCIAKYSCAGDCLVKVHSINNMFDTSCNFRCQINRGILINEIINTIEKKGEQYAN